MDAYRLRKSSELAGKYSAQPNEHELGPLIEDLKYLQHVENMASEKTISDYMLEIMDEMVQPPDSHMSCVTSYGDLDEMTGGLQRGI